MINAIVYESKTGFTKQYAEMLGKKINVPIYNRKESSKYISKNDEIIYMGWIMAGNIAGLKKVKDNNIVCIAAVGITPDSEEYRKNLKELNKVDQEVFYLRGGINYQKLGWFIKTVLKMVEKKLAQEENISDEYKSMFLDGANYVDESNLKPLIDYINGKIMNK